MEKKLVKQGVSNDKVAVIASCDRSGNKDFKVATRGRISKKDLESILQGKLAKLETLCSDSHRSYTAFIKDKEIMHKKFNASKGQRAVDKIYHVQNVNNMDIQYAQSAVFTPCDFSFPSSGIKAEATTNTEMILVADVDLSLLRELHSFGAVKNLKDRRKDFYDVIRINNNK